MKSTTTATFSQDIQSPKVVLVDVWATWCAPCRGLEPVLAKIGEENADWLEIIKLNSDENRDLVSQLSVTSVPTLFIYKNGTLVDRINGVLPRPALLAKITAAR